MADETRQPEANAESPIPWTEFLESLNWGRRWPNLLHASLVR